LIGYSRCFGGLVGCYAVWDRLGWGELASTYMFNFNNELNWSSWSTISISYIYIYIYI
jgi:hypothetical protein